MCLKEAHQLAVLSTLVFGNFLQDHNSLTSTVERNTDAFDGIYLYNWNIYVISQNDKNAILPHEHSTTKLMIWKISA